MVNSTYIKSTTWVFVYVCKTVAAGKVVTPVVSLCFFWFSCCPFNSEPSLPHPLPAVPYLLSVPVNQFAFPRSLYKWHRAVCMLFLSSFFHTASFIWSFIHTVAYNSSSFLFIDDWYSIMWIDHSQLIHSPFDGQMDQVQLLSIMIKTAMTISVQDFVCFLCWGWVGGK